jgi:hypothetical protein
VDTAGNEFQQIELDIKHQYKGEVSKVIFSHFHDGVSCKGKNFFFGQEYVVVTETDNWIHGLCSGTQSVGHGFKSGLELKSGLAKLSPNKPLKQDK